MAPTVKSRSVPKGRRRKFVEQDRHAAVLRTAARLASALIWSGVCPPFESARAEEIFQCIDRVANEHFNAAEIDGAFRKELKARLPEFHQHDELNTRANDRLLPATQAAYVFGVAVGIRVAPLMERETRRSGGER